MLWSIVLLYMTGNSIQTWMWVEKGVPGVSTCTVWQSEYPWFLICPFSHVVSLTTPTLCEVWEVSCNSFHKPYPPVSPLRKAPQKHTHLHGIIRHSKLDNKSTAFDVIFTGHGLFGFSQTSSTVSVSVCRHVSMVDNEHVDTQWLHFPYLPWNYSVTTTILLLHQ